MSGKTDQKYVLLDRDGTVIYDRHYLSDPAGVELLPGAAIGLQRLQEAGWGLIILTNQSGIGRGYFTETDYQAVTKRMLKLLKNEGIDIAGVYYCPHDPKQQKCSCRKPETGMADTAVKEHNFDPEDAYMIGDKPADINLGKAIGSRTILVRTGKGSKHETEKNCKPDYICDNLEDSAAVILGI